MEYLFLIFKSCALVESCYEDSTIYAHNDVWRGVSNCTLYQCLDGVIVPFVIQCQPNLCPKVLFYAVYRCTCLK